MKGTPYAWDHILQKRDVSCLLSHSRKFPIGWAVAAVAGMLVARAFEPAGSPITVIAGVVLWLATARGRGIVSAAVMGMCFGIGFNSLLIFWLVSSFGFAAWAVLVAVQSLWFCLLGLVIAALRSLPFRPVTFAAAWTVVEELRSSWPLGGFPWGRLGVSTIESPLSGLLPLAGISGTGLLLVLMAGCITELFFLRHHFPTSAPSERSIRRMARRSTVGLVTIVMAILGTAQFGRSALLPNVSDGSRDTFNVAAIQSGVPGNGRELLQNHRAVTANLLRATSDLVRQVETQVIPRPDLVVWPENSTAVDPFNDPKVGAQIQRASSQLSVPLLVGAMVDGPTSDIVLNQSILWRDGEPTYSRYTKHHPVPFGEYIPARSVLAGISEQFDEIQRDMARGTETQPLNTGLVPIAVAICFDVAFDDVVPVQVRNGARLAVVQTSNASFYGTNQLEQQFTITRARAAETGRSIVVASTNGVTGIIGSSGEVLAKAQLGGTEVVVAEVPLSSHLTLAVRWGHWVPRIAFVLLLMALGAVGIGTKLNRGIPRH